VKIYNIGKCATTLIKNVGSVIHGEQQLITNLSYVFVIFAPLMIDDVGDIEPIVVHATKIKGQDFKTNVEVCFHEFC
jgi:hypothetical protein